MTKNELFTLLNGPEWDDVEFKKAQRGVPETAYETVSSFSNTSGGWLVFGIVDNGGRHEIAGVRDVDKVQNDFLSALRADNKVNHDIQVESKLINVEGKIVLAFRIDPHTLLRNDAPPEYRVFREAAINLLIHQDYASHGFKAVIKFYRDVIQFWNPGNVFGSVDQLLEPGEKEVRSPQIVAAFRRLGLCEQAGTGIRMVVHQWQELGHPEPKYKNDRSHKTFEIHLPLAKNRVKTQNIGEAAGEVAGEATGEVRHLLTVIRGAMGRRDLQAAMQLKSEENFRQRYLTPALDAELIEMTIPGKPRSSSQKYRLTEKGHNLLKIVQDGDNS